MSSLLQNKDIITRKPDKANTILVIDEDAYKKKMKVINSDCSKFDILNIKEEKHLSFVLNKGKVLREIIKPLPEKGCFTKSQYLKICLSGSKPGILYGKSKVHKPMKNICPSFRSIWLIFGIPTSDFSFLFLKPFNF